MTYLKLNILPAIACLAFFSQDVMAADTDLPDPFSQAVTAVRQKDYSTAYQLFFIWPKRVIMTLNTIWLSCLKKALDIPRIIKMH